jgi:hypothetical protein
MTLCSVCGYIVAATVACYEGARRYLPCAAADGFEWRSNDAAGADLDRDAPSRTDDRLPAPRRRQRRAGIHPVGHKPSPER